MSSPLWLLACVPGAVIWLAVLLVPWRPWSTRERIEGHRNAGPIESDSITILIPARNEAARIGRTLAAIEVQAAETKVIVIDDCALAARVKRAGHRIWIGLSRSVLSHRGYDGLDGIWEMVSRTAFTQLRYSVPLLLLCVVSLSCAFWFPLAGLVFGTPVARIWSVVALAAMIATYVPTLRFYRLSPLWALLLPLTGTLYLLMTVDSALRYARGVRSSLRGRTYGVEGR